MEFNFSFDLDRNKKTLPALDQNLIYDLLVLGAGPAGLNAALYGIRKGLRVGLLGGRKGGQVADTSFVDNVLGLPSRTGEDLVKQFVSHLESYQVPLQENVNIAEYRPFHDLHEVKLENGETFRSRTVIVATGAVPRRLGVPGEAKYSGKGVAYCAICDGPLFKGKDIFVAGGGNSAVEAALDLAKQARSVTIVHRSKFRADKVLTDQLMDKSNIQVLLQTQIKEILGDAKMTGILVEDLSTSEVRILNGQGIFVEIGLIPITKPFQPYLEVNEQGEILTSVRMETNLPGVFAAGDVTNVPYKQIITAMSSGAIAALAANDYLNQKA